MRFRPDSDGEPRRSTSRNGRRTPVPRTTRWRPPRGHPHRPPPRVARAATACPAARPRRRTHRGRGAGRSPPVACPDDRPERRRPVLPAPVPPAEGRATGTVNGVTRVPLTSDGDGGTPPDHRRRSGVAQRGGGQPVGVEQFGDLPEG